MKSFIKKSLSLTVNHLELKNKMMRDLIRTILLAIAIYSGAIAAGSECCVNIPATLMCGAACSVFVITKDKKKYED